MITIIDYGMGNIRSFENAFNFLKQKVRVVAAPQEVLRAEKIIFPGVGNFGQAMLNLQKTGLDRAIKQCLKKGTPFLGVCLGLQLLFDESEEAPGMPGLSVFQGRILRFKDIKTPQIGWNQIRIQKQSRLLKGIQDSSFAYFMHSFYAKPLDEEIVVVKTNYGIDFCSALEKENVFGLQFHPEKSGEAGLKILKNFTEI